ncbi:MAG: hypothetical protein FWD15_00140 [Alphaproteobacteria bacterium]|nr:hypothetical protein [Alphaproteobacteria bacterium]
MKIELNLTFMDRLLRLKRSLDGNEIKIEARAARPGLTLKEVLEMLDRREPGKALLKNGRCNFLWIPDFDTNKGTKKDEDPDQWNKVHLTFCDILQNMENAGREDRYESTENTSGEFNCIYNDDSVAKKKLHVCKYCIDAIENSARFGSFKQFDFDAFAKEYNFEGITEEIVK